MNCMEDCMKFFFSAKKAKFNHSTMSCFFYPPEKQNLSVFLTSFSILKVAVDSRAFTFNYNSLDLECKKLYSMNLLPLPWMGCYM